MNRTGRAFLSHTDLGGAYTLRFAVSGAQTQVRAAGPARVRASRAWHALPCGSGVQSWELLSRECL